MKTIKVKIYGIVQGVYFRHFVELSALELEIKGWVKNCDDGTVEALFQGTEKNIEKILQQCKKGPPSSKVNKIDVEEINKPELYDFQILENDL